MRLFVTLVLLVLLGVQGTQAQEVSVRGVVESTGFAYLSQTDRENSFLDGKLTLDMKVDAGAFKATLRPQLRYASHFMDGVAPLLEDELRPVMGFKEAFIEFGPLRFGKLIQDFCLSSNSPMCPEDSFNPRDFIDPFNGLDERVGVVAVDLEIGDRRRYLRVSHSFGRRFSKSPIRSSRWSLVPDFAIEQNEADIPGSLHIAGKWSFTRSSIGLVLSRGQNYDPRVHFMSSPYAEDWTTLLYTYQKRTAAIVQLQFDRGMTSRSSFGYVRENGVESFQYSVETEKQILSSRGSLSILGGYTGAFALNGEFKAMQSDASRFRDGFFNSFFGGFERDHEPWTMYLGFVRTMESESGFALNPRLTYTQGCKSGCRFFEIELSTMVLGGHQNNIFGQYASNDRVGLEFSMGF